jgi:hypothetical protein
LRFVVFLDDSFFHSGGWTILTPQFQEETLLEFLNFAVDSGDIQLAATVLSVHFLMCLSFSSLKRQVCQDFVQFPQRQSIRLFRGYIGAFCAVRLLLWINTDLLQRQQLFSEATDILLACPHPKISQQNQNRTSISLSCAKCRKPLGVEDEAFCSKCRRIPTICSIWSEIFFF